MAFSITAKGSRSVATREGTKYIFIVQVDGLDKTNHMNLLVEGLNDPVSGIAIPITGSSSSIPGSIVLSVDAVPWPAESRTSAKVTIIVGPPELGSDPNITIIRISDSSGQRVQQINADGSPSVIKYFSGLSGPQQLDPADPTTSDPENTQYNFVEQPMPSPNTVVEFERTLTYCPLAMSRQFRRTVNANIWNGYPPGCVLFRGLSAISMQGGVLYRTRTTFEAAPPIPNASKYGDPTIGPWDKISCYRNNIDGEIPRDILQSLHDYSNSLDGGAGILLQKLPRVDFTPLNLPAITT